MIEKLAQRTVGLLGLQLVRADHESPPVSPGPPPVPLWKQDQRFAPLYELIRGTTLVDEDRTYMLYQLARYASAKEGDIAEVGVYRGGTARVVAKACPHKTVHLLDTFAGMPSVDGKIDVHKEGDFADTSLAAVKTFLKDAPNVVFHQGFFPATAAPLTDKKFCLVHIDVDIYQSTKDCLEFFYPRMVPGGVLVFDDYEWPACPGVRRALDEFLAGKQEVPIVTARYQCALIKL